MNPNPIIERSDSPSQVQDFLEDRLYEHNRDRTGRDDGQLFAFVIRDDRQEIVAGVSGWTWGGACEIRDLWVSAGLRGQGYGKVLLDAAEQEARGRGCRVVLLSSFSFQAPAFYLKNGYEQFYELADFPPGHRYSFLVKRLL